MSLLSEVLMGIRVVKMYSWEPNFLVRLEEKRAAEVAHLRAKMIYGVGFKVLRYCGTFVGFFTFMIHTTVRHQVPILLLLLF